MKALYAKPRIRTTYHRSKETNPERDIIFIWFGVGTFHLFSRMMPPTIVLARIADKINNVVLILRRYIFNPRAISRTRKRAFFRGLNNELR